MSYRYEFSRSLVTNFRECFRFYRDALGLKPGFGTEEDSYTSFSMGSVSIALFDKAEMSGTLGTSGLPVRAAAQDAICLVFAVDDVDAEHQRLNERGESIVRGPADYPDWGIRTVHLRDPDGNLIEINQAIGHS